MTQTNPQCFHQSASSIASFKACPQRFRLAYREGLRLAEDTDSQRVGTAWHKMHEIYYAQLQKWQDNVLSTVPDKTPQDYALAEVIDHLNTTYAACPQSKTMLEWGLERQILLVSFIGYLWYWSQDPIEVLASEVPFNLPIHAPKVGLPLPMDQVQRVGKIDHIIKWQNMVGSLERKSTSRSISPESDYWDKSKKDTQVSMYALAFRDMITSGQMAEVGGGPLPLKEGEPMPAIGSTLYDVWHKPTIKPAMLTQKETAEFIVSGTYCEQQFAVHEGPPGEYTVNGTPCEIEPGKKGFAIRETVEMYGARLLQDIYARPDFYFQRREIVRTDKELAKFRTALYAIYQTQRTMDDTGAWYENENSCRDPFPCSYRAICYGPGADACCDGKTTPPGYKRIFVDLTVNGQEPEE